MTSEPEEQNAMAAEAAAERTVVSAKQTVAAAERSVASAEAAKQDAADSGWATAKRLSLYKLASNAQVITFIWVTSAVLNVVFLASIVVLAIVTGHNTTALHNSSVSQCQQNNVGRRQDIAIWNQFLGDIAPPSVPRTPKVKAELAQINALIKTKDTPRNCVRVYTP